LSEHLFNSALVSIRIEFFDCKSPDFFANASGNGNDDQYSHQP